jgi:Tol biopolymer transport system component
MTVNPSRRRVVSALAAAILLVGCTTSPASPSSAPSPSASGVTVATPEPTSPSPAASASASTGSTGPGRIVFTQYQGSNRYYVYTVNPDGSGLAVVRSGGAPLVVAGSLRAAAVARWSPDGRMIGITTSSAAGAFETIVNADGSGRRDLLTPDPTLNLRCLAWSPDGQRMVCQASDPTTPSRAGIYTVRTSDGGDLQRLTSAGGGGVPGDYSPDGTRIAFVSRPYAPESVGQLWVCDVDGGNARKITDTLVGYDVSWSPDGRFIAADDNGTLLIFELAHLAVPPEQIVLPHGSATQPRWSPDGRRLVYQFTTSTTNPDVYVIGVDGSNPLRLSTSASPDDSPDWGRSP